MSLILVSFIMNVLFLNDFGILKTLGMCAVLSVELVPIAIQMVHFNDDLRILCCDREAGQLNCDLKSLRSTSFPSLGLCASHVSLGIH